MRRGNLDAIERKAAIINGDGSADTFFAGFSARSGAAASIVQEIKGISLKQLIDKYLRARDLGEESRNHKDLIAAFPRIEFYKLLDGPLEKVCRPIMVRVSILSNYTRQLNKLIMKGWISV